MVFDSLMILTSMFFWYSSQYLVRLPLQLVEGRS